MNIDRKTVRKILTEDLDMRKVCAKMVPKELTEEQKQRRVKICQDLLERQDDILGHVITGDETCVYQYALKRSGKVHNGRLPIPNDQRSSVSPNEESKKFCHLFFFIRGIVHYEFVPTGQSTKSTINDRFYYRASCKFVCCCLTEYFLFSFIHLMMPCTAYIIYHIIRGRV